MNKLFDIDGPVMHLMTKITYCLFLNILWFLCCLPIVTAGASTTALFYVTLKIAKNEEGRITTAFFHSFRKNFKQATVIWLILLIVGIVLGIDGYVFYHMRFHNVFWTIGTAVFFIALAAYLIILMYIFPLLSRFENTTRSMFKNALMIGMRFLFCTALMAVIYFSMTVIVIRIFTPAIILGEGLCALLCSYLLSNIFLLLEGNSDETEDDENPLSETEMSDKTKKPFKDLHGTAKIQYIWDYYKLPIAVICIGLYITGYIIYGRMTHKDTLLYAALVNVNAGETLTEELSLDYLNYLHANPSKETMELYTGLYLTDDEANQHYEYTYASSTKIVASIDAERLDVVLMDKEAFDAFSQNGYLCNMEEFLIQQAPELYSLLQTSLENNIVILEDNALEAGLNPSVPYSAKTEEYPMAVNLSQSDIIKQAAFNDTVYLGIIANTPRTKEAVSYLKYLFADSM